jgi:hypothetical protein
VSRVMRARVSVLLRESGQFPTGVKEALTLLVNSKRLPSLSPVADATVGTGQAAFLKSLR